MYATVTGLAEYCGMPVAELPAGNAGAKNELVGIEHRLLAYIVPNSPCMDIEAFTQAVYDQYRHEHSESAQFLLEAGGNVSSFQIGDWQASLKQASGNAASLFPAGLSPVARALLSKAGLLYKGGVR